MNYFTMFDGLKGYHMVRLEEESMTLTTFSTPFGLFQYTRLPMGISHSGDSFGSHYHQIFGDLSIAICVEDMCVYTATYPEMLALTEGIVERADKYNVSFNTKKTIRAFASQEGEFAGYRLERNGYGPSPGLTRAIAEFPRPNDKTDLRSFNGLCQQVGLFSNEIATALAPFSPPSEKISRICMARRPRQSIRSSTLSSFKCPSAGLTTTRPDLQSYSPTHRAAADSDLS
jgi:hypothetical protein